MSAQLQDQLTTIGVRRVAGNIGALITGVDTARPLDPQAVAEIRQALLTHKVIFFRGQDLDHAAQIAFARQFGDLTHAHPHEDAPPEDAPEILTIDPRRYEKRYGSDYQEQFARRQYPSSLSSAHRRNGGCQSACSLDPARGDRARVWRRHHMDQPGGGLRGAVRAAAALR